MAEVVFHTRSEELSFDPLCKAGMRANILDKAKSYVCGQRQEDYGTPEDNFKVIADLWNAYLGDNVTDAHDVAMMMALLKIARIRTGRRTEDSYVDAAGYMACGGEIAGGDAKE